MNARYGILLSVKTALLFAGGIGGEEPRQPVRDIPTPEAQFDALHQTPAEASVDVETGAGEPVTP